jgi:hypothetical protein
MVKAILKSTELELVEEIKKKFPDFTKEKLDDLFEYIKKDPLLQKQFLKGLK